MRRIRLSFCCNLYDFNPRTREECDGIYKSCNDNITKISIHALARSATELLQAQPLSYSISIHALARSATSKNNIKEDFVMISIHALARSATDKRNMHSRKNNNFNPRTREECDLPAPAVFLIASKFQSTHSRGVRRGKEWT